MLEKCCQFIFSFLGRPRGRRSNRTPSRTATRRTRESEPNGRPDTTTIKVLYASYKEFAVEAMRGVKEAHFRPARVAGCPVPVVVRMPIDFLIRQ